jgi:hypothetical protein
MASHTLIGGILGSFEHSVLKSPRFLKPPLGQRYD